MTKTTKRRFTDVFKREAVALWETSGRLQTDIARELGIMPTMLRRWQRGLGDGVVKSAAQPPTSIMASPADQASEIAKLRRELDRTRMERDILKKAVGIPSACSGQALRRCHDEVQLYRAACRSLAGSRHVPRAQRVSQRILWLARSPAERPRDGEPRTVG